MHPWSPARVFIRNGWLAVLLFAVAGCFGPPERELYEGDFPWLYIGVSCEERSYYSGIPICPHGEPDNIVYSGWILHGGENTDGQCGNLDRQPYGAVLALDVFLGPHRAVVGQFLVQLLVQLLARDFGGEQAFAGIADLVFGIHPRAFGHHGGERVLRLAEAALGLLQARMSGM